MVDFVFNKRLFSSCLKSLTLPALMSRIWSSSKATSSKSKTSQKNVDNQQPSISGMSPEPAAEVESGNLVSEKKLFRFLNFVKSDHLSTHEKLIHDTHVAALKQGLELYKDPETGYDVLTRLAHLQRGKCCGNACRHCPFGHQEVPSHVPKKRYNSAFYL